MCNLKILLYHSWLQYGTMINKHLYLIFYLNNFNGFKCSLQIVLTRIITIISEIHVPVTIHPAILRGQCKRPW